jgi:hypothetical protein
MEFTVSISRGSSIFSSSKHLVSGAVPEPARLASTGAFHFFTAHRLGQASVDELLISAKCDFMRVIDAPRQINAELFCVSMTRQS